MAIEGTASVEIDAPIEEVFAVAARRRGVTPLAARDQASRVPGAQRGRTPDPRPHETDGKVRTLNSTLRFGYDDPTAISWEQAEGD